MSWRFHFRGYPQKVPPMAPDDYHWRHMVVMDSRQG